jgi:hypothetical protein
MLVKRIPDAHADLIWPAEKWIQRRIADKVERGVVVLVYALVSKNNKVKLITKAPRYILRKECTHSV